MKLKVSSYALFRALEPLSALSADNNVTPITKNVLLDVAPNALTATATNLNTTIQTVIECDTRDSFRACIPLVLLLKVLKEITEQPITIRFSEDWVAMIVTASGKYQINGENPLDFPKIPEHPTTAVPNLMAPSVLKRGIMLTAFALSTDNTRPAMNALRLALGPDGLRCTATDGNCLADYTHHATTQENECTALLSRSVVDALQKLLPNDDSSSLSLSLTPQQLFINAGRYFLIGRLVDEKFPDFEAVFPKESSLKIVLNLPEYRTALKRVSLLEEKQTHLVKHGFGKGALTLTADDVTFGNSATETLSIGGSDEPLEIGFNSRILLPALANLTEPQAVWHLSQPNRAAVLRPDVASNEALQLLIMPLELYYSF